MDNNPKKIKLSKEQKTGFVLLSVFAILVIFLGGLQLRNVIYNPFAVDFNVYDEEALVNDTEGRLKNIDTDHDGLMDWDELNTYKTSPYLEDTDSDGIEDKVELDRGMNPLCVEKDGSCIDDIDLVVTSTEKVETSSLLGSIENTYELGEEAGIFANEETGQNMYTQALTDPGTLRKLLLLTGGISEEELAKIDDQTLLNMSKNLLQQDISVLSTTTESNLE